MSGSSRGSVSYTSRRPPPVLLEPTEAGLTDRETSVEQTVADPTR